MAEEVYGPFASVEETVKAVDVLELEGYSNASITIFSHGEYADDINKRTDASVTSTETSRKREGTIRDKISTVIFNGVEETSNLSERLQEKGLSEKQAAKYAEKIKSGHLLVTVSKGLKMGNDAAEDSDTFGERVNRMNY
ncbi:general stress protein [Lentibacillus amyloliquefaciens]|uniref:General stress protein 17M-like domain-containing protein n=1 Tax=Lentibacillus amyloliquefaciens TaxID=1472767 RepID=A0A0U3W6K5_9BACI|nr:general stress protein [Lentibacillus amyloliquefaciens]ALX48816.1 hypothetical protein AOX59_09430 [Lentibacillus amyloliquefaciens]